MARYEVHSVTHIEIPTKIATAALLILVNFSVAIKI